MRTLIEEEFRQTVQAGTGRDRGQEREPAWQTLRPYAQAAQEARDRLALERSLAERELARDVSPARSIGNELQGLITQETGISGGTMFSLIRQLVEIAERAERAEETEHTLDVDQVAYYRSLYRTDEEVVFAGTPEGDRLSLYRQLLEAAPINRNVKASFPAHPDAGKTVRTPRMKRSMLGVPVDNVRQSDGGLKSILSEDGN